MRLGSIYYNGHELIKYEWTGFSAYVWFNWYLNFGISFAKWNIEIHLPLCFVRVGWQRIDVMDPSAPTKTWRGWGWHE